MMIIFDFLLYGIDEYYANDANIFWKLVILINHA